MDNQQPQVQASAGLTTPVLFSLEEPMRLGSNINMLPSDDVFFHEAGHIVVGWSESVNVRHIIFPPPIPGLETCIDYDKQGVSDIARIRISVAGLHAQAIFCPESFSSNVVEAIAHSIFMTTSHPCINLLTSDEKLELGMGGTDIKSAMESVSRIVASTQEDAENFLVSQEKHVVNFLELPETRNCIHLLVAEIKKWYASDRGVDGIYYCDVSRLKEVIE